MHAYQILGDGFQFIEIGAFFDLSDPSYLCELC